MKKAKVITLQFSIDKKHDALFVATVSPNTTAETFLAQFGLKCKSFKRYEETPVMPLPFALALSAKKRTENGIAR